MDIKIAGVDNINTTVRLPYSKSISNRVLLIRALCYDWFNINNLSDSKDTKTLDSILKSNHQVFDVGDAGTTMRFLTAYLSKIVGEWTITGSKRMTERPIKPLVDALITIGANISYLENDGFPPLKILGSNLTGKEVYIDGHISSQFITALLLIAPSLLNGLKIIIKNKLISKPYVDMTIKLMNYFGVFVKFDNNCLEVGHQEYAPKNITIEPDWSAASYWYQIAAFANSSDIKIPELTKNSIQGDSIISEIYQNFGVKTTFSKKGLRLTKTTYKKGKIKLDLTNYPDTALALTVTCAIKKIPFQFTGLESLKIKECNRILALQNELAKFNLKLKETGEGKIEMDEFESCDQNKQIEIETYNDHRIAMAFAPVSMHHKNIIIKDMDVVKKSYPGFWNDLENSGFKISN